MSAPLLTRVALVAFLNVLVRSDIIGCPLQWNQFGCSCFLFGSKDSINWDSARERCRRYPGSHLATISTKAENNFVGMQLKNTSWLGLRRRANGKLTQEGEERGSFFAWDSTTASRSKTGCIAARPTKGRTWMAQECSKQYKYICEETVSKEPILCRKANWSASFDRKGLSNCPISHPYINGLERSRERFLKDDFISNLEGAQCCKAISPHTSEKSNCTTANWRLSLGKPNSWSECPQGYFLNGLYRSEGQNLNHIEEARCCKPENHPLEYGNCYRENDWREFDNDKAGLVTCKKPGYYVTGLYRSSCNFLYCLEEFRCCTMAECPHGWESFNSSCYQVSKSSLSFAAAQRECGKSKAFLAEISTQEENEFVLSNLTTETNEVAWFGLRKPENSTTFSYSNSIPNYAAIGVVQPKSSSPAQRCATLFMGADHAVWISTTCCENHTYVCETDVSRGFNVTILDVNETYAKVFWKIIGSNCDQVTVKGKYWLSLKQDDSTLFREDIYNNTPIKAFGNLTPSTEYEVLITEASERNGVGIDIFRHAFETSAIENPLKVMTNLSSSSIKTNLGESVTMLCAATGEQPVMFAWFKDLKPISSFVEVQNPFPSSILVIKLEDKGSFGNYICQIRDRFSKTSHTVVVADSSTDDQKKQLLIATVILAVLLFILIFVVAYLTYRALVKESNTEIKKADLAMTNVGNSERKSAGHPSTIQTSPPGDLQTEFPTYASLRRTNDETDENPYYHLRKSSYENL